MLSPSPAEPSPTPSRAELLTCSAADQLEPFEGFVQGWTTELNREKENYISYTHTQRFKERSKDEYENTDQNFSFESLIFLCKLADRMFLLTSEFILLSPSLTVEMSELLSEAAMKPKP